MRWAAVQTGVAVLSVIALGGCGGCDDRSAMRSDGAVTDSFEAVRDVQKPDKPDAAPDAPPDAYVAHLPECATAPATLIDFSPREIGNIALSGSVLYISAYEQADTGDISNSVILSIDLTTGQEAFAPVVTDGDARLVAVGEDVYASISEGGTILRLRPGVATDTVITGRPSTGAVTADATHVYWSERATPADPDVVKRRLLTGGPIEDVVDCNGANQLFIIGATLYCLPFSGSVIGVATDGSGPVDVFPTNGYPVVSSFLDGTDLYLVGFSVYPQLHRLPTPLGPISLVHEEPMFGRFTGITATPTHFYVTHMNEGIRRYRRSDLATTLIAPDYPVVGDPVIWNDRLYYATSSFTDADQHWLRVCVD